MKISEVINKLQEIKKEKGDLYVTVNCLEIEKFDYDDDFLNIDNGAL